jgi:hypothetical protein
VQSARLRPSSVRRDAASQARDSMQWAREAGACAISNGREGSMLTVCGQ